MAARTRDRPARLPRRAWGGVLKRTFSEFRADELTDWAAALTYYGILSIFPALIVVVSVLGLVGRSATDPSSRTSAASLRAPRTRSSRTR